MDATVADEVSLVELRSSKAAPSDQMDDNVVTVSLNTDFDKLDEAIENSDCELVLAWIDNLSLDKERRKELINTKKDHKSSTALHIAIRHKNFEITKLLLSEGADPDIKNSKSQNALHAALEHFSSDKEITELVNLFIERGVDINAKENHGWTPLHIAAMHGHTDTARILLEMNADVEVFHVGGKQPIHFAASYRNFEIVELLVRARPECVHWKDTKYRRTPLHYTCLYSGSSDIVGFLLQYGADTDTQDESGYTPLCYASDTEMVRLLLEAGAEVNPPNAKESPFHLACYYGNSASASLLLKYGANVDFKDLEFALLYGYKDIVEELISLPKWPLLLRNKYKISDRETTPFREMIRTMPDIAEKVLDKCTVPEPYYEHRNDPKYGIVFNYEFIEDTGDYEISQADKVKENKEGKYGVTYFEITNGSHSAPWGPARYTKENHPLDIMVRNKRLTLLRHPVVLSLLHHKWKKFGLYAYFLNLFTYCVFLIFLTTFALIIKNPQDQACLNGTIGINGTAFDNCGISSIRAIFIYITAITVLISSLFRLGLEFIQLVSAFHHYISDWINHIEIVLYICSIVFVWIFHSECFCPLKWQWQIGVVAVFLGWIVLVLFASKFPLTGIYVLMFVHVFSTLIKVLLLALLLIMAFGLAFHLTFFEPEISRSPFSTPALSLLATMSMTAGEYSLESIFRLDPTGGSDDAEEIPFPPISYLLWIAFVTLMPTLFANLLVGLAVDDIKAVQEEAALKKLALQVDQVLKVEKLLPKNLRRHFTSSYKRVYPNKLASFYKKFHFYLWGGEQYDTVAKLERFINPQEKKRGANDIFGEIGDIKRSSEDKETKRINEEMRSKVLSDLEKNSEEMRNEIGEMRNEVRDLKELMQCILNKLEEKAKVQS